MSQLAIGIDLGCTNIKAVLIDESGNIIQQTHQETNEQDDSHWKKAVADLIQNFKSTSDKNISAIGLSAPGLANEHNTCIAFMPGRMPGLENFNWSEFTKEKIQVLNDAHAALIAEASFGAAKNMKHAILLTLGTGVGGGILIEGKLYQGIGQMAGHFGHTTVESNTSLNDVTNMAGSLEDAIGNLSVSQRSMGKFNTTFDLVQAYQQGDTFATWLWLSSVRKLAISLASFINILSPEAIIIGGGISQAEDLLMKPLREFVNLHAWQPGGRSTPLKLAKFSDMAGAIGAAGFALSKIKK